MKQYQYLFDSCQEYMMVCDKDGYITEANTLALQGTGYGEELPGTDICAIFPFLFKRREDGTLLFIEQEDENKTTCLYRKNATCFPSLCRVITWEEEDETRFACCAQDMTKLTEALSERKRAVEWMEEAASAKSEFVANVTHELRTPINGIKGLAENLLDTPLTPAQVETINIILRCSNNMTKIINDLLDFSKMEAGKLVLEKREFDLHRLIKETLAFHSIRIGERGLKLAAHVSENVPARVIGDELRLGQIMNNLFSNAIKFTSVGQITFEAAVTQEGREDIEILFVISDTGIGISDEEKDKLFERFSQVDGSITRRFGGTGLGLAICKELVEMMHGSIQMNSEKGKGSAFSFSVCLKKAEQEEVAEEPLACLELADMVAMTDSMPENCKKTILDTLEKMELCAELGTWEKAENFAQVVRQRIPQDDEELEKKVFRLEMAVRKEDEEKTGVLLEELKALVEERIR